MTEENVKIGLELMELISKTSKALENLKKVKFTHNKESFGSILPSDTNYSLTICEYSDGSGFKANLDRYFGNTEILDTIINILELQLERFNKQFIEL